MAHKNPLELDERMRRKRTHILDDIDSRLLVIRNLVGTPDADRLILSNCKRVITELSELCRTDLIKDDDGALPSKKSIADARDDLSFALDDVRSALRAIERALRP
jgi:hypothetical protein